MLCYRPGHCELFVARNFRETKGGNQKKWVAEDCVSLVCFVEKRASEEEFAEKEMAWESKSICDRHYLKSICLEPKPFIILQCYFRVALLSIHVLFSKQYACFVLTQFAKSALKEQSREVKHIRHGRRHVEGVTSSCVYTKGSRCTLCTTRPGKWPPFSRTGAGWPHVSLDLYKAWLAYNRWQSTYRLRADSLSRDCKLMRSL